MPLLPWLSIPDPRLTGTDAVLTYVASEGDRVGNDYIVSGVGGSIIIFASETRNESVYRIERTRR